MAGTRPCLLILCNTNINMQYIEKKFNYVEQKFLSWLKLINLIGSLKLLEWTFFLSRRI